MRGREGEEGKTVGKRKGIIRKKRERKRGKEKNWRLEEGGNTRKERKGRKGGH